MNRKTFLIVLFLAALFFEANSQTEKRFTDFKISAYFGGRDFKIDSLPNTANIDFLNYFYRDSFYMNLAYLGINTEFKFAEKWKADIHIIMFDDLIPENFNISVQYLKSDFLRFNLGMYGFYHIMNEYDVFYETETDFRNLDSNYDQSYPYDFGFFTGISLNKAFEKTKFELNLNAGASSIIPFTKQLLLKTPYENEKRKVNYTTKPNFNSFLQAELEICKDLFSVKEKTIGLQAHSSYLYSKKRINYTQKTAIWTESNTESKEIKGEKHQYNIFGFDFGLYFRW